MRGNRPRHSAGSFAWISQGWLVVGAVLAALTLGGMGVGCSVPETEPASLACGAGEYFDVVARACKIPVTPEETYRGFLYERLSSEKNQAETTFQISFSRWLTPDEVTEALKDARVGSVAMVKLYFPTLPGGLRSPQYLDLSVPKLEAPSTSISQAIAFMSNESSLAAAMTAAHENGDIQISVVQVRSTPSSMASWWFESPELIRFIQSMRGAADGAQRSFEPEESVK